MPLFAHPGGTLSPFAHLHVADVLRWPTRASTKPVIGYFLGEGVGPEVMSVALSVLGTLQELTEHRFELREGGLIGLPAYERFGQVLTGSVEDFCSQIFHDHGALLCGPGGGRFVYELRRRFELFTKLTPIEPILALKDASPVVPSLMQNTRIVVVRENVGGLYQGSWSEAGPHEADSASQTFSYTRLQVRQILEVAVQLAAARKRQLVVVTKPGGAPSISSLWKEESDEICSRLAVNVRHLEVDNAAYQLIAQAPDLDVVVAPNLFGDILGDAGSLLLSSRGMSYSGNFGFGGKAVYQTAHGAAHDLAKRNLANPIGQVFSLAMMLRESFGLTREADAIIRAVIEVLESGKRTADIAGSSSVVVSTSEMGEAICAAMAGQLAAVAAQ